MDNPEKLVTRRGNQKWTIQRNWQHEGEIKYGKSRETGNAKGQSKMDNPEKLATRRGNQKWTIQKKLVAQGTQDEDKPKQKYYTICVGHHYT